MRYLAFAACVLGLGAVLLAGGDRFEQLTVDNTSGGVGFTLSRVDPTGEPQATAAVCRLRTAEISFTYDGTAPTASVGQLLEPGDILTLTSHVRIAAFRGIRTGATSGQLDCVYSR